MPIRQDLYDGCPSAHALDLIGHRWSLLVVRELLLGPKRFTDLGRGLPRISRNVLSQRLDELEAAAVLRRRTLAPPAAAAVYELTDRGLELESVLTAIGRWGAGSPLLPDDDSVGVDTFVLGLRARYRPAADADLNASYELQVGEEAFDFRISNGKLAVTRGTSPRPDLAMSIDPGAMGPVTRGRRPLADVLEGAELEQLERFAALFSEVSSPTAA